MLLIEIATPALILGQSCDHTVFMVPQHAGSPRIFDDIHIARVLWIIDDGGLFEPLSDVPPFDRLVSPAGPCSQPAKRLFTRDIWMEIDHVLSVGGV